MCWGQSFKGKTSPPQILADETVRETHCRLEISRLDLIFSHVVLSQWASVYTSKGYHHTCGRTNLRKVRRMQTLQHFKRSSSSTSLLTKSDLFLLPRLTVGEIPNTTRQSFLESVGMWALLLRVCNAIMIMIVADFPAIVIMTSTGSRSAPGNSTPVAYSFQALDIAGVTTLMVRVMCRVIPR